MMASEWFGVQEAPNTRTQMQSLEGQIHNNAGGYSYKVDDTTRLLRFLVLGNSNLRYHYDTRQNPLTRESAACLDRLIAAGRHTAVINCIRGISLEGRNPKQNPILFALSLCARSNNRDMKTLAYKFLPDICRTPTHLFQFIKFCEKASAGRGWGRAHRRAISNWYISHKNDPLKLAYEITKYRRRLRYRHKDVLRLAHVRPEDNVINLIMKYIVNGLVHATQESMIQVSTYHSDTFAQVQGFLNAVEQARSCDDENELVALIIEFNLTMEHIPTQMLGSVNVWQALISQMPMTTLIRNLGKISSLDLLTNNPENERKIVKKLTDINRLKMSRIHPFNLLVSLRQYGSGHSRKGRLQWRVNQKILKALDEAFHLSFANIDREPTGKRFLLAVDVSNSMNTPLMGCSHISAREASAALMMVTTRLEQSCEVVCFANDLCRVDVHQRDTIGMVINKTNALQQISFATDCARPITYAIEHKMKVDVFIIYTDSQTNYGSIHPADAIVTYRKASGISDARLLVVGLSSNGFTIANPDDPFMMDVVGFDSGVTEAIKRFIRGEL